MPSMHLIVRAAHAKGFEIAYLYQLKFPNDMIYIGCTKQDPILRLYAHRHNIRHTRIATRYSATAYALNYYNEVCIKILAIGDPDYIRDIEPVAIRKFDTVNKMIGYNKQYFRANFAGKGIGRNMSADFTL